MKSLVQLLSITIMLVFLISCNNNPTDGIITNQEAIKKSEELFVSTMIKHLNAVTNRDAKALASTLAPSGKMQLILPGSEIINSTKSFMEFHEAWFKDTTWTFETKILNTEIGSDMGIAVTELTYREPERNGKPYFNRQIVSYALKKEKGQWYIIKDHCTSVEKSTDKES